MSTKAPPKKTTISFRVYDDDKADVITMVRTMLHEKGYNLYATKIKTKTKKNRRSKVIQYKKGDIIQTQDGTFRKAL